MALERTPYIKHPSANFFLSGCLFWQVGSRYANSSTYVLIFQRVTPGPRFTLMSFKYFRVVYDCPKSLFSWQEWQAYPSGPSPVVTNQQHTYLSPGARFSFTLPHMRCIFTLSLFYDICSLDSLQNLNFSLVIQIKVRCKFKYAIFTD